MLRVGHTQSITSHPTPLTQARLGLSALGTSSLVFSSKEGRSLDSDVTRLDSMMVVFENAPALLWDACLPTQRLTTHEAPTPPPAAHHRHAATFTSPHPLVKSWPGTFCVVGFEGGGSRPPLSSFLASSEHTTHDSSMHDSMREPMAACRPRLCHPSRSSTRVRPPPPVDADGGSSPTPRLTHTTIYSKQPL
jgi:hypothetical protein